MVNFRIADFSILPFDKCVIQSNFSREEAGAAIYNNVDFRLGMGPLFGGSSDKEFRGKVGNTSFKITRVIGYRNSFLPIILGEIERNTYSVGGSQIVLKMRMSWPVIIFSAIWMGITFVVAFFSVSALINGESIEEASLIPLLMFVFGFFLINGAFSYEANKARKLLINIFEGEELK